MRTVFIKPVKIFGGFVFFIFIIYILSFVLSSNKSLVLECFRVFAQEADIPQAAFADADSLNIISSFEIQRDWLTELKLKKVNIIELEKAIKHFPCNQVGLALESKVNLGIIRFVDVSNQPCEDTIIVKAVFIWTGFNWKVLHSSLGGMA